MSISLIAFLAVPGLASGVQTQVPSKLKPKAAADAASTILSVTTSLGSVEAARDSAQATGGASPRAYALLVAGTAANTAYGQAERESTQSGDSKSDSFADQTYAVDNLLNVKVANASVSTAIGNDVKASADIDFGTIDIMNGFATIDSGSSSSTTLVNDTLAHVTRAVDMATLHTFSLGDLLRAEGASVLDLTCDAVAALGAQLGVDATQACTQLAAAQTAVNAARTTLQGVSAQLLATKNSLLAQVLTAGLERSAAVTLHDQLVADRSALQTQRDTLATQQADLQTQTAGLDQAAIQAARDAQAAICPTLVLQALIDACNATVAGYDAQLALFTQLAAVTTQLTDVDAQITAVNTQIDAASAEIDAKTALITSLNSQVDALVAAITAVDTDAAGIETCATAHDALVAASSVPAAGQATSARSTVDAACDLITQTLASVIDAPVLSMGGVHIAVDAVANDGAPKVTVSGTIGSIKVGNSAPLAVDVNAVGAQVRALGTTVKQQLDQIMQTTNLELPVPEFEFMVTSTSKGKRADGTWFASGAVTALRIHFPAVALASVSETPFAIVANGSTLVPRPATAVAGAPSGAFGAPLSAVLAAAGTSTPDIVFDLGTFVANSEFKAAPKIVTSPNTTPRTFRAQGHEKSLPFTGVGTTRQMLLGALLIFGAFGCKLLMRHLDTE